MQTEETRALIKTYYETLPTGNRDKLASLLTEDVEWYPPESAPLAVMKGREAVTRELGGATPKRMFDMPFGSTSIVSWPMGIRRWSSTAFPPRLAQASSTIMSIAGSTTAATGRLPRLKNTPTRIKLRAL